MSSGGDSIVFDGSGTSVPDGAFTPLEQDVVPPEFWEKDRQLPEASSDPRVARIRTSDRILFRRCRRRWNWSSHLRQNIRPLQVASPLWIGTGVHFALEDFHGWRKFEHPAVAWEAYVEACKRSPRLLLPDTFDEDNDLGIQMLEYYADYWLADRPELDTFWYDSGDGLGLQPQVEVNITIRVPLDTLAHPSYDAVDYSMTLDRVAIDKATGYLWIVEYKTAARFETRHLETDPQVTAYCWGAGYKYPGYHIAGVIYQQHRKVVPDEPIVLASGKLSTNKNQNTTYVHYKRACERLYGKIELAPPEIINTYNHFCTQETPEANKYIRRDITERTPHQLQAEGEKILLELEDMLNPNLPLYPNPTRECHYCPFQGACIAMDDGSDWEQIMTDLRGKQEEEYNPWRKFLPSSDSQSLPSNSPLLVKP